MALKLRQIRSSAVICIRLIAEDNMRFIHLQSVFLSLRTTRNSSNKLCEITRVLQRALSTTEREMDTKPIIAMQSIFRQGVASVQPKNLFAGKNKCFEFIPMREVLVVGLGDNKQTIDVVGKHCHLVGFGKAVLGMAVQIEQMLGDRLVSGIVSVPVGTVGKFAADPEMQLRPGSCVKVFEGAADNLPDDRAAETARLILNKCEQMDESDVLIVLISGGGSALIPLPVEPITVTEKRELVKSLAGRQATINEINNVRIALSRTKGGKLAEAARNAYRCISLVISDVCEDPLDIIASGPTVESSSNADIALTILRKYDLVDTLPESIKTVLVNRSSADRIPFPKNSSIYIIGNNLVACSATLEAAQQHGLRSAIISTQVIGNVSELSHSYVNLIKAIYALRNGMITLADWNDRFHVHCEQLKLQPNVREKLASLITNNEDHVDICLIAGGEPTVEIRGNGVGGRNQELALRISALLSEDRELDNVVFLSAGTDGIDGPTPAAGAIGCSQVVTDAEQMNLDVNTFVENNDSFNLYRQLNAGKYHIITGHTGTNVMDLHIFVVHFRQ